MSRNITITGNLQYRDGSPIEGAVVRIWEMDIINSDDLIVDVRTNNAGRFSGTGRWRDFGDKPLGGRYRYQVVHAGKQLTGKNILKPHKFFATLQTPWSKTPKPQMGKGVVWANWNDNFKTRISRSNFRRPDNADEVAQALEDAIRANLKVKVVGSGHSMSAVAQPKAGNMAIDLSKLSGGLDRYTFERDDVDSELAPGRSLGRVKAGTTIRTTNVMLARNGQGLLNMGPFDGQTIAGVVNTNTHGNGVRWGGFADMVRSMEMFIVRPGAAGQHQVERWIIEPSNGITDRAKFEAEHPDWCLAQDDDLFHSAVCGYGLFGIAVSYVLEVRNHYWLRERGEHTRWGNVRTRIQALANETRSDPNHQLKIYLHTAQAKTKRNPANILCRIERLTEVTRVPEVRELRSNVLKPAGWENRDDPLWPPMRKATGVGDDISTIVGARFLIHGLANSGRSDPIVRNSLSEFFFKKGNGKEFNFGNKGEFISASAYYRAIRRRRDTTLRLHNGLVNNRIDNTRFAAEPEAPDHAPSMEIAVPIARTAQAVEEVLRAIRRGNVNLLAPMGIRFSAASDHRICPAAGREVAFIEIAGTLPTLQKPAWPRYQRIYRAFFAEIEAAVRRRVPQARTHLGKVNTVNATQLARDYPEFGDWIRMYAVFATSGVFDCPISDRWGLAQASPAMSDAAARAAMDALKSG